MTKRWKLKSVSHRRRRLQGGLVGGPLPAMRLTELLDALIRAPEEEAPSERVVPPPRNQPPFLKTTEEDQEDEDEEGKEEKEDEDGEEEEEEEDVDEDEGSSIQLPGFSWTLATNRQPPVIDPSISDRSIYW